SWGRRQERRTLAAVGARRERTPTGPPGRGSADGVAVDPAGADRRDPAQPADRRGQQSAGVVARTGPRRAGAELAVLVVAPTPHGAVAAQRVGAVAGAGERRDVGEPGDGEGHCGTAPGVPAGVLVAARSPAEDVRLIDERISRGVARTDHRSA